MRVGCRSRSRGVESCRLTPAAKLLRRRLVLHAEQRTVTLSDAASWAKHHGRQGSRSLRSIPLTRRQNTAAFQAAAVFYLLMMGMPS